MLGDGELDLFSSPREPTEEPPAEPRPNNATGEHSAPAPSDAFEEPDFSDAYDPDSIEDSPSGDDPERPAMGKQITFFGSEGEGDAGKYTTASGSPVYVPRGKRPHVLTLCRPAKSDAIKRRIRASFDVTADERAFLLRAADRHVAFDYENIAEYYAHASPEMQKLMEESALVIVDVDSAIENGYVQLSETVRRLYLEAEERNA